MKILGQVKTAIKSFYPVKATLLYFEYQRIQSRYADEAKLLTGKHLSNSNHQSILFFTTHKCASVYVSEILKCLTESAGLTHINLAEYGWETGKDIFQSLKAHDNSPFKPRGYFYGPFRGFTSKWDLLNLEDYLILLMLRDPRDVLTSAYFSLAYSHSIPSVISEQLLQKREKTLNMSIDDYVVDAIPNLLSRYNEYILHLLDKPNVLFVKYEDMVFDFDQWLDTIIEFFDVNVNPELLNKFKQEANFQVPEEQIYSHKRQVTPGDHKRKLKPATIETLNSYFTEVLVKLEYTL